VGPTPQQEQLAAYVLQAARRAGYDMDSPRGGGKAKLAHDAGMSATTLSRLLGGTRMPDARYFEPLAAALKVPVTELLVEAGIVSRVQLGAPAGPATPEEVADSWGLRNEDRDLFFSMVDQLRKRAEEPSPKRTHSQRGVGGHPRPQSLKADEQPEE
jgi:transcriptional regulator with XRE-family HTH domain